MGQPRKPKGTSSGGQFDNMAHAEADTILEAKTSPDGPTQDIQVDFQGDVLGRGGWPRDRDGRPLVVNRYGKTHDSGPREGQVEKWAYNAASGAAIDPSPRGLGDWQQRQTLLGFAGNPDLAAQARAELAEIDPDDTEAQDEVLTRYAALANEESGTARAADRGTFAHWISECNDKGESPVEGIGRGEALGIDRAAAERIASEWQECCDTYGFEMLDVEASVANDEYRVAGTTDRVMRLTKPLDFKIGKDAYTIPAGTVVIGDLKTGTKHVKSGRPQYWGKYAAQLAGYAGGTPYDPVSGRRGDWPGGVRPSQDVGIIIHGDLESIASGAGDSFSVHPVLLEPGREFLRTSNELRRRERLANRAVQPL